MKSPDKIYVPQHNIEAGNIQELGELIVAGSTEYIRKDALLEWLEGRFNDERNRNLINFGGVVTGTQALGRAEAFKEVIDKLNSL